MVHAINKIPPLPEMIPLIGSFNPDFLFRYSGISPSQILSLLEAIGNPPEDLFQLWEDYQFMNSLDYPIYSGLESPPTDDNDSSLSTEAIQVLSQCPLLPHILRVYILVGHRAECNLHDICLLSEISCADLRAALCPLRHIRGYSNPYGLRRLLWYVAEHLSPKIAIRQLSLELAQRWMRLWKEGKQQLDLWYPWGCFIRASLHSLELLQDIRQASFDPNDFSAVENYHANYHDTLQWLKAFPDPPQDVIEVWEQHLKAARLTYNYKLDLETHWREWQANLMRWFPHLPFR
ncbi:hypothetical protein C8J57DRAFT_1357893 [Mycena rebaudengoi]|nr:hypothetical protein C8J57DRAFT_1357893 [Mycena rebaudengoi]